MAGVPGLAHHERPEYLDASSTCCASSAAALAWLTNATAGLLRVAVQLVASRRAAGRDSHPVLLLLPLFGVGSFLAGRRAQRRSSSAAAEATAEPERAAPAPLRAGDLGRRPARSCASSAWPTS